MSLLLGFELGPKHCQEVTTKYIKELINSPSSSFFVCDPVRAACLDPDPPVEKLFSKLKRELCICNCKLSASQIVDQERMRDVKYALGYVSGKLREFLNGTQVKQALVACGSSFLIIYICNDLFNFIYRLIYLMVYFYNSLYLP